MQAGVGTFWPPGLAMDGSSCRAQLPLPEVFNGMRRAQHAPIRNTTNIFKAVVSSPQTQPLASRDERERDLSWSSQRGYRSSESPSQAQRRRRREEPRERERLQGVVYPQVLVDTVGLTSLCHPHPNGSVKVPWLSRRVDQH